MVLFRCIDQAIIKTDKQESMDEKEPLLRSNSFHSSSSSTSVASSPTPTPPIVRHLPGRATKLFATLCILLTELCERLTFYGLTANLVLFCKDMLGFRAPYPTTVNLLFQGTVHSISLYSCSLEGFK